MLIYSKIHVTSRQRPYHIEHTSSRPITEVKQHWASLVLGWVTAWEYGVLLAFYYFWFRSKRRSEEIIYFWPSLADCRLSDMPAPINLVWWVWSEGKHYENEGKIATRKFFTFFRPGFVSLLGLLCNSLLLEFPLSRLNLTTSLANGHIMLNIPVLVRSLKSSNIEPR